MPETRNLDLPDLHKLQWECQVLIQPLAKTERT